MMHHAWPAAELLAVGPFEYQNMTCVYGRTPRTVLQYGGRALSYARRRLLHVLRSAPPPPAGIDGARGRRALDQSSPAAGCFRPWPPTCGTTTAPRGRRGADEGPRGAATTTKSRNVACHVRGIVCTRLQAAVSRLRAVGYPVCSNNAAAAVLPHSCDEGTLACVCSRRLHMPSSCPTTRPAGERAHALIMFSARWWAPLVSRRTPGATERR
jgi:hypothetical protein